MPRGIARKLIIYLTLMVIVVEGGFALLNIRAQQRQLLNEMSLNAESVSQTMVSTTWHAMLEDRRETVYEMMESVGRQANVDKVRVFNKSGRIMFSSDVDSGGIVDIDAEACGLCHAKGQPLVQVDVPTRTRVFRRADGSRVMGMVTPIYNEPSCSNAACHAHPANINVLGVIDVTMPLDRVDRQMADLRLRSVLLSTVSVAVLAFFVFLFARRFVQKPVQQLIEATKTVGALDLDRPLDIAADDELGDLARSFRSMQERIRESNRQIREFTDTLERRVEERTQQLHDTEKKLIQSDRLASLGQLAASVAHEINNPLGGVINFSKLMQRLMKDGQIPPERVDDFRTYLNHVVTETVRCGNIVRDLLVFARHSTPRRDRHDFNEIVRRTLSVINHRLELGEVTPALQLGDDLPEVLCDASQVQQIVTNLVLNAAEAMEAGVVTVRTWRVPERRAVALSVSDTGSGIPPENLRKIYDPFFSTKAEGQGTGLGLAVVYGIVESHGGQIEVDSVVDRGTTFTITLPVEAAAPAEAEAPPPRGAGGVMRLALLPIGAVEEDDLDEMERFLRQQLPFAPRRLAPLAVPPDALDPRRRQHDGMRLLRAALEACPPDAARLLAVTELDLFIPMLTFIFGQAQLDGTAALVSLARLRPEFHGLAPRREVLTARYEKEILHELGHTFGLTHCHDARCAMSLSINIANIDRKQARFCPDCDLRVADKLAALRLAHGAAEDES